MKTCRLFAFIALLGSAPAWADYRTMTFPPAHEIFQTLQADPTEPRFGFEYGVPVSHHGIARVQLGDYLGLYRWAFPRNLGAAQLSIGGAVFSRFDGTPSHSLQVIDYYGNVPLDVRLGPVSMRFMFYHDSSHLGDDYLREKNMESTDHSWEALRGIISVLPFKALRIYAGYTNAIHTKPDWAGHDAVQGGTEIYFNPSETGFWHPYWANDVQSWARSRWNPTWSSELGLKTGTESSRGRGIAYYVRFQSGPRYEGQFFTNHETVWSLGLKFQLSQALENPATRPEPPSASAAPADAVVGGDR